MPRIDIRVFKNELRADCKEKRRALLPEEKEALDDRILKRMLSLREYRECSLVVTYVSTPIEVGTHRLIEQALADGKRVAVPRCIENYLMDFYEITSMDDLEKGSFSVLEPIVTKCRRITEFPDSICIVPGLSFDKYGCRLGYGKGYYDRFLSAYRGFKVGACYQNCLTDTLPHGRYDVAVDIVITEKGMRISRPLPMRRTPFSAENSQKEKKAGVRSRQKKQPPRR